MSRVSSLESQLKNNAELQAKLAGLQSSQPPPHSTVIYVFDGVLHYSVHPSPQFDVDIKEAVYLKPGNLPRLVPAYDMIEQLKLDQSNGHEIVIIVNDSKSTRKDEVEGFLRVHKLTDLVKAVIYMDDTSAQEAAISASKLIYDCNPATTAIYATKGINVRFVDIMPRLNAHWIY